MVAYGVLVMKHKSPASGWLSDQNEAELEQSRAEDFERDQLRKLVNDELRSYGLLLKREVVPTTNRETPWRTRRNMHVLYGQVEGRGTFARRPELHAGDFKECCEVAAKVLDEMDAAQIPEGKT